MADVTGARSVLGEVEEDDPWVVAPLLVEVLLGCVLVVKGVVEMLDDPVSDESEGDGVNMRCRLVCGCELAGLVVVAVSDELDRDGFEPLGDEYDGLVPVDGDEGRNCELSAEAGRMR